MSKACLTSIQRIWYKYFDKWFWKYYVSLWNVWNIYESPASILDQGFVKTFITLILTWTILRNVLTWPHDNVTYLNYVQVQYMQIEWHDSTNEWMNDMNESMFTWPHDNVTSIW